MVIFWVPINHVDLILSFKIQKKYTKVENIEIENVV